MTNDQFYQSAIRRFSLPPQIEVRYFVKGVNKLITNDQDWKEYEHLFKWVEKVHSTIINLIREEEQMNKLYVLTFYSDETHDIEVREFGSN